MPSRRGHEEAACQLKYSKTRIFLVVATLTIISNFTLFACIPSRPIPMFVSAKEQDKRYTVYLRNLQTTKYPHYTVNIIKLNKYLGNEENGTKQRLK